MSIEKNTEISELYTFRRFHDKSTKSSADYENELLNNMLSRNMFKNNITNEFLNQLQKNIIWMLESTLVVRNFWNYTVNKYYNKYID
jgi:hypothetical protein